MRFAIRDDDASYFTRPEDLEQVWRRFWDAHPVSLGVVPFHGCTRSGALPEVFWTGRELYPLHENRGLVAFLKAGIRAGRVSILLHGYDHVDRGGRPEFASGLPRAEMERRLGEGLRYLEDLLETRVGVFVPPHNEMSREALAAAARSGVDLMGTFSFRPGLRALSVSMVAPMVRRRVFLWRQRRGGWARPFYPFPLQVDGHREMACHDLNRDPACSWENLESRLARTLEVGGDFCLATHYWEAREPPLSGWLAEILRRAALAGARFVHVRELFDDEGRAPRGEAAA